MPVPAPSQRIVQNLGNGLYTITDQTSTTRQITLAQLQQRLTQLQDMKKRHNDNFDAQIADAQALVTAVQAAASQPVVNPPKK